MMIPVLQEAKNVCTRLQRFEVRGMYGRVILGVFGVGVSDLIGGIVDRNGASLNTLARFRCLTASWLPRRM